MEDKEWVLMIQNLTKTILDLQQENQQYKNAWEELKNKLEKIITITESMQVHDYVNYVCADMQELEQKHNLDKK